MNTGIPSQSGADRAPSLLNRICAYPMAISWVVGACAANGFMLTMPLVDGVRLTDRTFDWQGTAWLLVMVTAMTGVGLFLGVMMGFPWLMPLCGRINGAPLKVGDRVLVLSGRWRGITAKVHEITIGQGGWKLARLDLGPEERAEYNDLFEPYSVFKISSEPAEGMEATRPKRGSGE